ncbi:sigma factor-like helix-turn-helix DNA-binding protein [Caulobacter segnis]
MTFRRNATGFHQGAEAVLTRHHEVAPYFLAIAIELALKAYLLDRGISDDWNRVYLRHDLVKALRFACRAGFTAVPAQLPELAALLSPYYSVHAISEMPPEVIASVCWTEACTPVRELIGAVAEGCQAARFQRGERSVMTRLRVPWPLAVSQWWRWRYPDLWRGRTFDPHNTQQVMSYAVLRLRREARDVFLLNHIKALDYGLIARRLGLSVADVQAHLADALYEISRTVDLIERVRPLSKPSEAEHPNV